MKRKFALIMMSSLALSTPGHAQVDSTHDLGTKHAAYGRLFLRDYAKCVVRLSHDSAKKFVLATSQDGVSDDDRRQVLNGYCTGAPTPAFVSKTLQSKGILAEALNQRENKSWPALSPASLPALDWSVPDIKGSLKGSEAAAATQLREMAIAQNKVGRLGECIVRANPAGAVTALNTTMDDPAELVAFKALTPEVVACIKTGETASFNRTDLRAAIALSYYGLENFARALSKLNGS